MPRKSKNFNWYLSRTKIIVAGFVAIILIGTLLLMLPFSTREGEQTTFSGALFTSVSAGCVTGLVVYDTCTHWTLFGQLVILALIQIGGLGFVTIGVFALTMSRKKIGLGGRELIHDSLSTLQVRGSVRLVRRIVFGTAIFEGMGAVLLAVRFIPQMGVGKGIYYAVFHSVSAFCNAGFDLMGYKGQYSSFCGYVFDPLVNFVLMALIIIGGIGFIVWEDVLDNKWHFKRYRFQTKIVLTSTAVLIFGSAILFFALEYDGLFAGMELKDSILAALFCAVTPRTAGFNTVDTAALSNGSTILTIFLMFIGGSPGSTAGGIKTTTLVVILLYVKSYLFNEKDLAAFRRRLDGDAIKRACVVVFVNYLLALAGGTVIMSVQSDLPFRDIIFEVFSAIGTVGMSTGVTRDLNILSRIVIILLMFCGRVGSLTFAMSFTRRRQIGSLRYPEEQITVG